MLDEHFRGVLDVPERVRPDRHAAGVVDRLDASPTVGVSRRRNAGLPSIR